jgi:Cu/Ag efflux protein CusF
MKPKSALTAVSLLAAASLWTLAHAQATPAATPSGSAQMADMTDGEVRKIDNENKKITLKHGEIKNLQMPGMTMVFQVKDPAMLDGVKQGDKVMFKAEKSGGAMVVTEMHPAK